MNPTHAPAIGTARSRRRSVHGYPAVVLPGDTHLLGLERGNPDHGRRDVAQALVVHAPRPATNGRLAVPMARSREIAGVKEVKPRDG